MPTDLAGTNLDPLLLRVLDTLDDVLLVTEATPLDEPGPRIVYVNAAFTRLTGYERGDVLGLSPRLLQCDDTDADERRRVREALAHDSSVRVELLNVRKSGERYWTEMSICPVTDATGATTHFVSVQRDTSERKAAETDLRAQLLRSPLQGLRNRAGVESALAAALPEVAAGGAVAVLSVDVDGLRQVNQLYGRGGGDAVLAEVGQRLLRVGRAGVVGQLAGGEFAVLLTDAALPDIVALGERIRRALAQPVRIDGAELQLSFSMGVATAEPDSTPPQLLMQSDLARQAARSAGSRQLEFFEPAMTRALQERVDLDQGLRRAVRSGELLLHFQPIVDLASGACRHVEALVRWDRPGSGLVSPGAFIPVAEDSGAILPVGAWVLARACRQAHAWQDVLPGIGVAVNVSTRQLAEPDLPDELLRALDGLLPHLLTVEVTESALLADPSAAAAQLQRLADTGVRIALDDFGTGWSSLAYLKRLPVSVVKVDKTFVDGVQGDAGDRAVLRAVRAMTSEMGLDLVAEGVERPAQAAALQELGYTDAQGYLYSRPVPVEELVAACARSLDIAAGIRARD